MNLAQHLWKNISPRAAHARSRAVQRRSATGRAAAFALCAIATVCVAAPAQAGETVTFGGLYDVSVSGFRFASASLSLIIRDNAYSAKLDMHSAGLGRLFSSGRGEAESSGWMRGNKVYPRHYYLDSTGGRIHTNVQMALSQGRIRKLDASPPLKKAPDRIPVTKRHQRNVLDPLSAILMPVRGKVIAGREACNRTLPVFDGWTRYDVKLSYEGTKEIKREDYSGPVVICSARWKPVAGHRPDKASVKYMANNREIEIWLAPVADLPLLTPYRIQIGTRSGTLVVSARKIKVQHGTRKQASIAPVAQ